MIFTLTIHPRCHFRPMLTLDRNHSLICKVNQLDGFYAMITLLISDTTFSIYYFQLFWRHSSPQVFNLARLVSLKHSNKDTSCKTTQQQLEPILWWLGNSSIKLYTSLNLLNENKFNLKGYYQSKYFLNLAYKTL